MSGGCLVVTRQTLERRPLHVWLDYPERTVLMSPEDALRAADPSVLERFRAVVPLSGDYTAWTVEQHVLDTATDFRVDRVVGSSEDDVLRLARVRAVLDLPGQPVESALAYRDKLEMLSAVAAAGMPVPETRLLHGPVDLLRAVEGLGLPMVVKPRLGAASEGVRILRETADVQALLRSGLLPAAPRGAPTLLAQQFVHGAMCHVDGVMQSGRVLLDWPGAYSCGVADLLAPEAHLVDRHLGDEDPRTPVLRELAARVVSALPAPPDPTAFHLEAWLDSEGRATFCEIASRPGGATVPLLFDAAFGLSLSRANFRGQAGDPVDLPPTGTRPRAAAGAVVVAPGRGTFVAPDGPPPPGLTHCSMAVEPGARSEGPRYGGDSALLAGVAAPDHEALADRLAAVLRWWRSAARWK